MPTYTLSRPVSETNKVVRFLRAANDNYAPRRPRREADQILANYHATN